VLSERTTVRNADSRDLPGCTQHNINQIWHTKAITETPSMVGVTNYTGYTYFVLSDACFI